jgi:hypothetical protein
MPKIFPIMPYAEKESLLLWGGPLTLWAHLVCKIRILLGNKIVINGNKGEGNKIVIHIF